MESLGIPIPELCVVIPMLNAAQYLHAALASLASQRMYRHWQVVVADNGSTDGSREIVESYRARLPALTIVDASDRRGRAHAVNVGVRASSARSIVFFDADDVLAPGYLLAMSRALRTEEFVCARREVESLNARHTFALRPSSQMNGPMNSYSFLPFAGGGTLGVTRRLFDKLGGLDTSIDYLEDIDFCWRAQLDAGARLAFVPGAMLRHRYRTDARGVFQQTRMWTRDEAKLRRIYEQRGMPSTGSLGPLRALWALRRLSYFRTPAGRYVWFRRLGSLLGQVEGLVMLAVFARRERRWYGENRLNPGYCRTSDRKDGNGSDLPRRTAERR
jgi:GT2 family glycosyltransferase